MAAPLLVATAGDPTANTYATRARAVAILAAVLGTAAWDDAENGDEDRDRALLTATALLDEREWAGCATATTQALKFPRRGLVDADGRALASDTIPAWLERATVLLALALLRDAVGAAATNAASALAGFKKIDVGPVSIELPTASSDAAAAPGSTLTGATLVLPADVRRLVARYLRGAGQTMMVRG